MGTKSLSLALAACLAVASAGSMGCAVVLAPVAEPTSKVGTNYDPAQIENAIVTALAYKGWSVEAQGDGEVMAVIHHGGHMARVRIPYDAQGWSIQRVETSEGLKYADGEIHKRYNLWVDSLDQTIRKELVARHAGGATAPTETEATAETATEGQETAPADVEAAEPSTAGTDTSASSSSPPVSE